MAIQNAPFTLFNDKGIESRVRSLRFDMNAMSDFEQLTGMGLAQLLSTRAVFAATRALLWAGLKHQDRALTVDRVGDLMQEYVEGKGGSIEDLLSRCVEVAIEQKALPDSRKKDESADPNSKPQTQETGA